MLDYSVDEIKKVVREVLTELQEETIPIGISNRHIHLTEEHFQLLFPNEQIEPQKKLKQPGEYAAKQTLTIIGPKGSRENVRILGPLRKQSQVEISKTDARTLGINAPIRLSGNLKDAVEITLKSPAAEITIPAVIIAKRHIHMSFADLEKLHLTKGEIVSVKIETPERTTIFDDVELRPGEKYVLEMHVDTDEANAANIGPKTVGKIIHH